MNENELKKVKNALMKELDTTLQQCCHQKLTDVVNDLHVRYGTIKPDASPDEVFSTFLKTGLLKIISAEPMVRMQASLERLKVGTFGQCSLCGNPISSKILEEKPTTTHCDSCMQQSKKLMH